MPTRKLCVEQPACPQPNRPPVWASPRRHRAARQAPVRPSTAEEAAGRATVQSPHSLCPRFPAEADSAGRAAWASRRDAAAATGVGRGSEEARRQAGTGKLHSRRKATKLTSTRRYADVALWRVRRDVRPHAKKHASSRSHRRRSDLRVRRAWCTACVLLKWQHAWRRPVLGSSSNLALRRFVVARLFSDAHDSHAASWRQGGALLRLATVAAAKPSFAPRPLELRLRFAPAFSAGGRCRSVRPLLCSAPRRSRL